MALRCGSLFIRQNYNSNSVTFLLRILLVTRDETTLTSLFCIRNVVSMPAGDGFVDFLSPPAEFSDNALKLSSGTSSVNIITTLRVE